MDLIKISTDSVIQIYYYLAIFATIVFVIKLIMFTIFGGDSEVAADFNSEIDTDVSFNFISIQSVLAFFMGFGWMGYGALQQFELTQLVSFVVAFIVGFIFMFVTAYLMFMVKKLEKNVKKDKTTALDKVGKAYTAFEPRSKGQIEIDINGQLTIAEAINATEEHINSFEVIKVVKVLDDILYIEKLEK